MKKLILIFICLVFLSNFINAAVSSSGFADESNAFDSDVQTYAYNNTGSILNPRYEYLGETFVSTLIDNVIINATFSYSDLDGGQMRLFLQFENATHGWSNITLRTYTGSGPPNPYILYYNETYALNKNDITGLRISYYINGTSGGSHGADMRLYELSSTSDITITPLTPIDNYNSESTKINFSINVEDPSPIGISNITINVFNTTGFVWNTTNSSGLTGIYNFTNNFNNNENYQWNVTLHSDTNTKTNSSTRNFNITSYKLSSETYNSPVFEAISTTISANILTNGSAITYAILYYNSTAYPGTINNHGSNNFTITKTLTAPSVDADTNISFNWSLTQAETNYSTTTHTQQVNNLGIDDCSVYTHMLYNFTIVSEETQLLLGSTIARLNLQIYGSSGNTLIEAFNKTYTATNPFTVCLSTNLSTGGTFTENLQVQYLATNYSTELYHLQNETITIADFPTNITLRDLNSSAAQIFKIIFRDSSFLPVEDALIKIYRKYIDENLFKITEIPMTDSKGEAIASLITDSVIYKFEIIKYGTTLATFTDVVAVCQTPLVTRCEIDLNAFSDTIVIPDYETADNFNYTLGYDSSTRLITSQFLILSGGTETVSLNVTMEDALSTSVCSDILTSSSGTLSCTVPANFGNATAIAQLYKGGVLQAQGQIKLDSDSADIFGVSLVILSLFVMITLIGAGLSNNPVFTIIFFMVGIVLLFALNLVSNNGFIGATATVLWLFIAIIIVIIKASGRN